jgi:uncharacterized protein (TIGR03437 family)
MGFEMYVTGAGSWSQPMLSDIYLTLMPFTARPVSLTIGGRPAQVIYAGTVGFQNLWGLVQVNGVVPEGVGPGLQPLVVRIGGYDNAAQGATIAIR